MLNPPRGLLLTGRIKSFLADPKGRLPVSCTVFVVQNTYTGQDGIADSLVFTSYGLRNGAGVAMHLSNVTTFVKRPFPFYAYLDPSHPDHKDFNVPNRCPTIPADAEVIRIADSMESTDGGDLSIEASWVRLLNHSTATPLVYDFSLLRPKNTDNGKGIVASGPLSFYQICQSIYDFLQQGTLLSLMAVYSKLNEVLRRGGRFKNGAVVLHLDYSHPDVLEFVTAPRQQTAWARLSLNVDPDFLQSPLVDKVLPYIRSGDLFLVKKVYSDNKRIYHNVCVGGSNYVLTTNGPKQVTELVNVPFYAESEYSGGYSNGFFKTGQQPVCKIITQEGFNAIATPDHRFQLEDNRWLPANKLRFNQKLRILHSSLSQWGNNSTFDSGYHADSMNITADSDAQRGYLNRLFKEYGFVSRGSIIGQPRLALRHSSLSLHTIQLMLLHLGIYSRISNDVLYIVGGETIKRMAMLIGGDLIKRLVSVMADQPDLPFIAHFSHLETLQNPQTVFDASVKGLHAFSLNGLIAHNCLEILLDSRATCLLAHINLGLLHPHEIGTAMENGMAWLCEFHGKTGVEKDGNYLSPTEDRQVGLGFVGLANLLAIEGVTYAEFVSAFRAAIDHYALGSLLRPKTIAEEIATQLVLGFDRAKRVAESYGMRRAFTVAPTASCSYSGRDRHGYTTAPEIAPPVDRQVTRISETMEEVDVDYHPDCETAEEVGWDVYWELINQWMRMMDLTGLGHSISSNWWSDKVVMDVEFLKRWFASNWKSLYYAQPVTTRLQDKSEVLFCDLDSECTSCAE